MNECSICLESVNESKFTTECEHVFCEECIKPWLKLQNTCPYCRKSTSKLFSIEIQVINQNKFDCCFDDSACIQFHIKSNKFYNVNDMLLYLFEQVENNVEFHTNKQKSVFKPSYKSVFIISDLHSDYNYIYKTNYTKPKFNNIMYNMKRQQQAEMFIKLITCIIS